MIAKDESFFVAMDALNQICRYRRTEKRLLHLHNVTGRVRRYYGKRADLRTEVTRIQSTPNFPKNKRFLPPDTHMYVYYGKRADRVRVRVRVRVRIRG